MSNRENEPASPIDIVSVWAKNPEDPEGPVVPYQRETKLGFTKFEVVFLQFMIAHVTARPNDPVFSHAGRALMETQEYFDALAKRDSGK